MNITFYTLNKKNKSIFSIDRFSDEGIIEVFDMWFNHHRKYGPAFMTTTGFKEWAINNKVLGSCFCESKKNLLCDHPTFMIHE